MNKNSKNVATVYTYISNLGKIKIENNIKTFERFKLNVGADASVRPQTTDYRKLMSNNLTSNFPASNSAITLIALIITIIVLLILAGVTLNMVMGENGIIKKAQLAKEKTNEAQEQENKTLNEYENKINDVLNVTTRDQSENKFSLEEQAVGTWINGKTIYRKVFNPYVDGAFKEGYSLENKMLKGCDVVDNNEVDLVIESKLILLRDDGYIDILNSSLNYSGSQSIVVSPKNKCIYISLPRLKTFYIILEYTKTTDIAN